MAKGKLKTKITVNIDFKLTLWSAIKLRIAGDTYKTIFDQVMKDLKKKVKK